MHYLLASVEARILSWSGYKVLNLILQMGICRINFMLYPRILYALFGMPYPFLCTFKHVGTFNRAFLSESLEDLI